MGLVDTHPGLIEGQALILPLSRPVAKFLDWEKGVVGEGALGGSKDGGEEREGIDQDGIGQVRVVTAKARESKFEQKLEELAVGGVLLEEVGYNGGRR